MVKYAFIFIADFSSYLKAQQVQPHPMAGSGVRHGFIQEPVDMRPLPLSRKKAIRSLPNNFREMEFSLDKIPQALQNSH